MNDKVRTEAKKARIPLWAIAKHIGISEPTITRWMRSELSEDRAKKIFDAIAVITKERDHAKDADN